MKTLRILSLLLIAGVLFSCQKDVEPEENLQEVSFGITKVDPIMQKDGSDWITCPLDDNGNVLEPTVAKIEIQDPDGVVTTYTPKVFYIGDQLYTQAIKLEPGTYIVKNFFLLSDLVNPVIIMAVPLADATFSKYVTTPVEFNFTVNAFEKAPVPIEVLCFLPKHYNEFGFNWFEVGEIVVRNHCFFGDICVKNPESYANSWYANAPDGLQLDMSAIMEIEVWKKVGGVFELQETFSNVEVDDGQLVYSTNMPLCITYPDRLNIQGEEWRIRLKVLVNTGDGFEFVAFDAYKAIDDSGLLKANGDPLPEGDDGVHDFVVGTCNYDEPDMQFAPWLVLPEYANVTIDHTYVPGGYWTLKVNSVSPAGTTYDFPTTGTYLGWCGDPNTTISEGTANFYLYSSMYNLNWPSGTPVSLATLAKVNWLFNNLETYGYPALSGKYVEPWTPGTYTGSPQDLQEAVWKILDPSYSISDPDALAMYNAANANGANFLPLPGEFAAVLMIKNDDPNRYQLIFTMVDP